MLDPDPTHTLVLATFFLRSAASLRPSPPEKEDMLLPPDDRLLDVGVSQPCRRLARHSLVASALESVDEFVRAGAEESDAASSTPSLRFVTGVRGRFCADLRTDSAFCLGGSHNSGNRFMCPIVKIIGPTLVALERRDREGACHCACLQWQLRSTPSLSGSRGAHQARHATLRACADLLGVFYTPFPPRGTGRSPPRADGSECYPVR